MLENIFPKRILSRRFYEWLSIIFSVPFYLFFLLALGKGWVSLPEDPFASFFLFASVPLILISIYFTSYKKILPQRLGDSLQVLIAISIVSAANALFGERISINGPFFMGFILLIPFFLLLLDYFLPLFIGGVVGSLLIIEFLVSGITDISFLSFSDFILKIIILLIFVLTSSNLIRRILTEQKTSQELRKTSRELRVAYRSIEALSRMKSEFLKVVNHQLRTPVSIIKGMLSMMEEGSVKGEKLKEYIRKSYLSSERLSTILDDILLAQGLIGAKEDVKLSSCQLEELIGGAVNHSKSIAKDKNLKIVFEKLKEPLPITLLDAAIIERVVSRLIDNAILYTDRGKITVSLELKKEKGKDLIQISVKDSGIGLDKEDKKNLFRLFHRGEKATSLHPNGSGLGLFIVKNLIESHKGKVKAKSAGRSKGSTFIISIPLITEV